MSNNLKTHKILKLFYEQEKKSGYDSYFPPDVIKYASLTLTKVQEKFKYDRETINFICHTLLQEKYISIVIDEMAQTNPFDDDYLVITFNGKKAYKENLYLNKVWFRTQTFWFFFVGTLIATVLGILALK